MTESLIPGLHFPIVNRLTACFGLVSVVIIAFAKESPAFGESESAFAAFAIPALIFSIGNWCPIMPVEATRTSRPAYCVLRIALVSLRAKRSNLVSCISLNKRAVFAHIFIAFSTPRFPVQVLAQPELTTTA
jgi:hypothetical protein